MKRNSTIEVLLALIRAGLWEQNCYLSQFGEVDYGRVLELAQEQSVVGLVAAGLEHVVDVKVPKEDVLQFVGLTLQEEQRNTSMNAFIAQIVQKMREADIYTLLVKGQGIAQCYNKPLWRASGDIDFLFSNDNYEKAKQFLIPLATSVEEEEEYAKHIALTINTWVVELHGTLHSGLSRRIDRALDEVQYNLFYGGNVRSWLNSGTLVFLPGINDDIICVFSHILQHFFKGGIGLRQICDLCRLLYTYKNSQNHGLLESRIKKAGLMTEWKAFAALAVDYLGMPVESMPLYSPSKKWSRKGEKVLAFVLETGNFGHNRDNSYYGKYPFVIYKAISLWRNTCDSMRHFVIFPKDAFVVWLWRLRVGFITALMGK